MKTTVPNVIYATMKLKYGMYRMEHFRNLSERDRKECLELRSICHRIQMQSGERLTPGGSNR